MNNSNSLSTKIKPNYFSRSNTFFKKDGIYPLLPLPSVFWDGSVGAKFVSGTKETRVPGADSILSEYGLKYLQTHFTARFVLLVNVKVFYGNSKVAYARNLYEKCMVWRCFRELTRMFQRHWIIILTV